MNNSDSLKVLLKHKLKTSLSQFLTYFIAVFFILYSGLNFFIRQGFFSGKGTTDLLLFFSGIPYVLILIIPTLCYKSGAYVYDSFVPVKPFFVTVSNFLNSLIISTVLILFLIPVCFLVCLFGSIDLGQLFISILFLILYCSCSIAICLFINELIEIPVLSFVISSLILALFNSAHLFVVYFSSFGFLAEVCKTFSFAWHFNSASKGIFDTREFVFFLGVCFLFLYLSDLVQNLKKGKRYSKKIQLRKALTLIINILVILNSSRYYFRLDFSKNKLYSPAKYTKELLRTTEAPLKITYYRSSSLSKLYPQIKDVQDYLITYSSLNKNLIFTVKDPDKNQDLQTLLENYGITSQQMQTVKNNGTEFVNVYSAIVLEYLGNVAAIPFSMTSETLEYDLNVKVKQLVTGKQRVINILCGNEKSLYSDYQYVIPWLNSKGFVCNPLYLEDPGFSQNLNLSKGPLVVIGDSNINIDSAIAIENYILSEKGNALLYVSPFSVNIEEDWAVSYNKNTNLVEMVENWGVRIEDKIMADPSCARVTMYSQEDSENAFVQNNTYTQILNYPMWVSLLPQEFCKEGMTIFWGSPITLSDETETIVKPLLITSPASYCFNAKNNDETLITNPFELAEVETSALPKNTNICGVEISGKLNGLYNYGSTSNSKVILIPDQYSLNSLMTGYIGGDYGDYRNFNFFTNCILKLNNEMELAQLHEKTNRDTSLYKITDLQSFAKKELITLFVICILYPLLIILTGVVLWLKRKSRLMHI